MVEQIMRAAHRMSNHVSLYLCCTRSRRWRMGSVFPKPWNFSIWEFSQVIFCCSSKRTFSVSTFLWKIQYLLCQWPDWISYIPDNHSKFVQFLLWEKIYCKWPCACLSTQIKQEEKVVQIRQTLCWTDFLHHLCSNKSRISSKNYSQLLCEELMLGGEEEWRGEEEFKIAK